MFYTRAAFKQAALQEYNANCWIPKPLRSSIPTFVKDRWLRTRGLPTLSGHQSGNWKDFQIVEDNSLAEIDRDIVSMLAVCTK